jgi:hypothetical protein
MALDGVTRLSLASTIPIEPTDLWAARVAARGELPDRRLHARFADVLACLAAKPADSIPQACADTARAKAAYRFFENKRVTPDAMLASYVATTAQAACGLPVVYVVHDSTSFNYSSLKHTTGLGPINDSPFGRGLHLHTSLALRPDGTPLGLLHQRYWARPLVKQTVPAQQRPPQDRESIKWSAGVRAATAALAELPPTARPRAIHVMDREGDITDVLRSLAGGPDGFVIRNQYDRRIAEPPGLAHAATDAAPVLGTYELAVAATGPHPKRVLTLAVRGLTVTVLPSTQSDAPIRCGLVDVREVGPSPAGVEPVHWRLWTAEDVDTFAAARAVVGIYAWRPRVEEFHLTLKSGCQVERLELETADRLQKALVLYSGIAVRIVALRDLARREPDVPCTRVLTADEWQALAAHIQGRVPARPPTLAQAVKWIARLGGHLGRKCDGPPGIRVLWRGWRDLEVLTRGFRAGRAHPAR